MENIKSLIHFEELEHLGCIQNGRDLHLYSQYFDVVNWLNENK